MLQLQGVALDRLMSPGTALASRPAMYIVPEKERRGLISLNEGLRHAAGRGVEPKRGGEIDRMRRNLQREHVQRAQGPLVRVSTPLCRPTRRASLRANATTLRDGKLRQALARQRWDADARAPAGEALLLESGRWPKRAWCAADQR